MTLLSKAAGKVKQILIIVAGFLVLGVGIAMIVLPGPAIVFIPAGLGILAGEFLWARRILHKVKDKIRKQKDPGG